MITAYILIFILSCLALFWSGSRLVDGLINLAKYWGWRKFVVGFFIMAFAGSIPNLFVGVNAALHKIPLLAFGEIVGGNIVDLTLAIALVLLIGGSSLSARSKMVQNSTIFTVLIAMIPLLLIMDGKLGRIDALVLISAFVFYLVWLFSKEERFKKKYNSNGNEKYSFSLKGVLSNLGSIMLSLIVLLLASEGIVRSAQIFADALNVSLPLVGILIVGVGNALPETYFAIISARKKQTEMILGNLMGSVIVCATFVLGVVALIHPIQIDDFSSFIVGRIFLVIAALWFFIAIKTGRKITKKEGIFFLIIYILFVITEIYLKDMIF